MIPTQERLNKSNKVKWSKLKKMAEEQQLGNYNQPQMSTSSKEKTLSKKAEPTISNLPNLVIKSVKPSLCNKDRQLVHVPILLFLTAYIPNQLICQDCDSAWLLSSYLSRLSKECSPFLLLSDHCVIFVVFFLLEK